MCRDLVHLLDRRVYLVYSGALLCRGRRYLADDLDVETPRVQVIIMGAYPADYRSPFSTVLPPNTFPDGVDVGDDRLHLSGNGRISYRIDGSPDQIALPGCVSGRQRERIRLPRPAIHQPARTSAWPDAGGD